MQLRAWPSAIGALALAISVGSVRAEPAVAGQPAASKFTVHLASEYGQYADTDHVFVETPSIAGTVSNPAQGWSLGGHYRITQGDVSVTMHSHIGGNGSCAGCHADPAGPASPGHVYLTMLGMSP
jgi:hypothetical protein